MTSPVVVKELPLEEEYKKGTGVTPDDVTKLREWLSTQPHLPGDLITDLELILTYHCCERSSEVAKQVLDLHYTLRTHFTNFFKDRVVDDNVVKTCQYLLSCCLDGRTREGYAVCFGKVIDSDVKKFVFIDCIRQVLMVLDLWQREEGTWPGLIIIIDMDGIQLGHLGKLDLQSVQQFLYFIQEALLLKLKGIHFLNAPSFMDKLLMILRPFMKKALMDILHIHQIGAKTLDKWVPQEILPKELGGTYRTIAQARDDTIARLKLNADYYPEENKKRVVESKRPGRPKTISDIFGGVEGSFKKLDID